MKTRHITAKYKGETRTLSMGGWAEMLFLCRSHFRRLFYAGLEEGKSEQESIDAIVDRSQRKIHAHDSHKNRKHVKTDAKRVNDAEMFWRKHKKLFDSFNFGRPIA
jgi:hypothetical protein